MSDPVPPDDAVARRRLVRASFAALASALLLTVLVVLPAEYAYDPTGFGALSGLTSLSAARARAPAAADAGVAVVEATGAALGGFAHEHPAAAPEANYRVTLRGDEELEYKADVARGEALVYRWRVVEGSPVYFEFHGEPTTGTWPRDYYASYAKGEAAAAQGSLVVPFTGRHGWYWLNLSGHPVTIEVRLVGYHSGFQRLQGP